jgi:hypothetical protein
MISRSIFLVLCAALSGCFGGGKLNCEDQTRYGYSDSSPPIRVPEGLDVPNEEESLQIPPGERLIVQDPETLTECLETPPSFFED